jgi:hypothetical protein
MVIEAIAQVSNTFRHTVFNYIGACLCSKICSNKCARKLFELGQGCALESTQVLSKRFSSRRALIAAGAYEAVAETLRSAASDDTKTTISFAISRFALNDEGFQLYP